MIVDDVVVAASYSFTAAWRLEVRELPECIFKQASSRIVNGGEGTRNAVRWSIDGKEFRELVLPRQRQHNVVPLFRLQRPARFDKRTIKGRKLVAPSEFRFVGLWNRRVEAEWLFTMLKCYQRVM
ncbi:hypothetical protein X736_22010 [Mesorhizobium sp. L2C089B000]|nr:hypothetical protein X736_22010 [Mesorhizobium sp. L2C089B000]